MDPNENWVSFCVNDRVSARFHDQDWWFDATITDILSSGKIRVMFDNGIVQEVDRQNCRFLQRQLESRLSPGKKRTRKIMLGDSVSVILDGGVGWFDATVDCIHLDGSVGLIFSSGDIRDRIPVQNLRLLQFPILLDKYQIDAGEGVELKPKSKLIYQAMAHSAKDGMFELWITALAPCIQINISDRIVAPIGHIKSFLFGRIERRGIIQNAYTISFENGVSQNISEKDMIFVAPGRDEDELCRLQLDSTKNELWASYQSRMYTLRPKEYVFAHFDGSDPLYPAIVIATHFEGTDMVVEVKYEDGEMRHVRASSVYVHQFLNPYSVDQSADVQGYHEVLIPVDRCGAFWPFRVECIQWEWEAGRHWTTYEMVSACILESQWHRYCTYGPSMAKNRDSIETSQTQYFELPIPSLTENYEVDFSTMEQKNSKTGTKRRINRKVLNSEKTSWNFIDVRHQFEEFLMSKLVVPLDTCVQLFNSHRFFQLDKPRPTSLFDYDPENPPLFWEDGIQYVLNSRYTLTLVHKQSQEFQVIEALFNATRVKGDSYKAVAIQRIQNPDFFNRREQRMEEIRDELRREGLPLSKLQLKWLWHGTKNDNNVHAILHEGFEPRLCVFGVYGQGAYFARNAEYSMTGYASQHGESGLYRIILAEVAVAQWAKGSQDVKMPPKTRSNKSRMDSTADTNDSNPNIFVTYDCRQALPRYIVYWDTKCTKSQKKNPAKSSAAKKVSFQHPIEQAQIKAVNNVKLDAKVVDDKAEFRYNGRLLVVGDAKNVKMNKNAGEKRRNSQLDSKSSAGKPLPKRKSCAIQ